MLQLEIRRSLIYIIQLKINISAFQHTENAVD